ncbi:hypothetical protein Q9295_08235 [Xinfangfangia sp. CPCC 101601]|uniref:Argininosuccinate lyase n=1 Tax=Pseudogemmobacter lacusdianii TaxID=3069608 RepID=A0ABU0VXW7_9RHOB|nr:hypothetical protein [Xinfangfangia sp. CPCC 101601]MDQ2066358.1 hypothetical protein [Xinfangfangia sp. CPCC 101601]
MRALLLLSLLTLAACGADGPPRAPGQDAPPANGFSGQLTIGTVGR